jgi:type II secretory pathway pseudopilin PulG
MGTFSNQRPKTNNAFTRLELIVVLACVCLLGLVALPMLGRSHSAGCESVCMNNLRNLGRAMLVYSDQNRSYVPEEGNIGVTVFNVANSDAWYNLAVLPEYPAMKALYLTNNYPLPASGTIYSCPAAQLPVAGQPSIAWAYFMYAENARACVNKGTTPRNQTRISAVPRPSSTILMAEVNDDDYFANSGVPANSAVLAQYTAARHDGFGIFSMMDGSVRVFSTNDYSHNSTTAAQEWYSNGTDASSGYTSWPCYWWPTSTTQQ